MLRPPVGCEVRPVARLGVAAGPGLRGSFRRARIRSVFPGLEIAVVDGTRIVVFLVLAVPVAALTVRRIQKAREDQRVVVDRRRRLIDRRVDPDVDGSLMLCNLARSLFMRVQAARDSADRDALAQLVSGDALRGIELCRVKVDGKPKVFYAGTRAGVTDRHDGAVFLIEAKLREYDTDDQGHERPRDCGERNVHEHWTLAAEGSDGPWKVVAIEADANLYGGPHELEAVAASMFVQVQAARDRGDAAELRRLVSGDLLRSIELFGGDSDEVSSHVEIVGDPPRIRYVGKAGEGFEFAVDARLREYEQNAAGVQMERGRGTYELRERWTLALGSDRDWKVIAIAEAHSAAS